MQCGITLLTFKWTVGSVPVSIEKYGLNESDDLKMRSLLNFDFHGRKLIETNERMYHRRPMAEQIENNVCNDNASVRTAQSHFHRSDLTEKFAVYDFS